MASGSGTLVEFAQKIAPSGSGTLINFTQKIVKKGSGNLVKFGQSISSSGDTGTLITFIQHTKVGSGKFRGLILS